MSGFDESKKYESFKIPGRQHGHENSAAASPAPKQTQLSFTDGPFYEIEYDACPIPGVGKFVQKSQPRPQPLKAPEKDETRALFIQMRDIARAHPSIYDFSRFFDRRIQNDNAAIFYKQGMFMKDFTDAYDQSVPFSQYFPAYQMMGYQQLRTYFTWRTETRKGNVRPTSLSYVFLYIYELLNQIGIDGPQDGLTRLMALWEAYQAYDSALDKYLKRWLKDYRIYYGLETPCYEKPDSFELFCGVSKYDIRKSAFFTGGNEKLIQDCFAFVLNTLRQVFAENGLHFDDAVFQPPKKMAVWLPFKDAIFYQRPKQEDRRILLSPRESYICSQGRWGFTKTITTESGRQLVGYIMKQMEAVLRRLLNYKFKLSADASTVTHPAVGKLNKAGLSLEAAIDSAVVHFYREATKTVVKVDRAALSQIRQEALSTQQKLIVPEEETTLPLMKEPESPPPVQLSNSWTSLKTALTETEIKALAVLFNNNSAIKKFADEQGLMVEVLVDGINEKAMDCIGDSLIDEDFVLYDDYNEHVKEWIG